jgi:peptidyl-prolyl cis-trans isomerase SurA
VRRPGGVASTARGSLPRSFFALLGMGALAAAALSPGLGESGQMADRIVAVVNFEVIMLSELKAEVEPEAQRLRGQLHGPELEKRLHQAEYTTLTRIIERRLQVQVASSKGIEVTEPEVQQAIEEMKKQGEGFDDHDPLRRKMIKDQLTLMRFVEREVRGAVTVFDPEMRKYYETHQKRFSLPEEFRLSQILFLQRSTEDATEFQRRAEKVYQTLKEGADFGDMALKHSAGAEASRRGNLGFVRQGELLPEIERAVADLQPGQFTPPIESPQGLHIIRLDEKKRAQYRPFAEVKSEIQALVYQEKSEDFYQEWIGDLKNKAYIEIKF